MPDTPEELSLQNADTNFTSIEENNEVEQNKQRDSIFAAVNNEALTQLSSLQIQLPVEIAASTEVNPDLNKKYTEEPRDIIFIATSFFNNPHSFGAKEIPFKESTKAYIIETSSMFYAYREFARNENAPPVVGLAVRVELRAHKLLYVSVVREFWTAKPSKIES
jgi:hypothetical protein